MVEAPASSRQAWARRAVARPVVAAALAAAVVRVAFAVIDALVGDGVIVPDESQYLGLARWVADGRDISTFGGGFGPSLLGHTPGFVWPLAVLAKLLGSARLPAALFAASFGVATVALTTWLALRVVRRDLALVAGLVVALLPSQVLFSSVVLRESMVWASLALLAVAAYRASQASVVRALAVPVAMAATALLTLGWLRDQTLFVAAWIAVPAALAGGRRLRWHRAGAALALALLVPVVAGIGLGGKQIVSDGGSALGRVRTNLSMSAESSFAATTTTVLDGGEIDSGDRSLVQGYAGETYVVDDGAGASLRAAPRGLVAVVLRPFPWEGDGSMRAAAAEDLLWYPLYVLAAMGTVVAWRRRIWALVLPVLLAVGIVALAAVTQGNLGTSFRHRGQILWVVALLAVVAVDEIFRRRAPAW